MLTSPCWFRSLFLLGVSLGRILRDPFLIGIPLDFTKRGEQVIALYIWYVGGKQPFIRIVNLYCPFSLNVVSFMKVSTFEHLAKYFFTSSLPMSAMEADGCKKDRQPMLSPQSVSLRLTVCIFYFLPHQYLYGQSLTTKLVGYNLIEYIFIEGKFWQIHHWITSSSYILYPCKIYRKLKINNYVINKLFKLQFFCNLKLCIKYELINHLVNNIQLTQNLTYVLRA